MKTGRPIKNYLLWNVIASDCLLHASLDEVPVNVARIAKEEGLSANDSIALRKAIIRIVSKFNISISIEFKDESEREAFENIRSNMNENNLTWGRYLLAMTELAKPNIKRT